MEKAVSLENLELLPSERAVLSRVHRLGLYDLFIYSKPDFLEAILCSPRVWLRGRVCEGWMWYLVRTLSNRKAKHHVSVRQEVTALPA